MIEARAIIENIEKTKEKVEELGAEFKNDYAFKDIIFVPKKEDFNLSDDFVRVRVYSLTYWKTKNVVLVRKKTEFKEKDKIDKIILREEFDTKKEAFDFISKNLAEFEKGFDYSRKGWEYHLDNKRIFIEDIEGYKPSIEIEAKDEKELEDLFDKIGIIEIVKESVPEIIRKLIK